jgi:hypothetical protein
VKEEKMDFFKQIRDVWVKELNKLEIKDVEVVAEVTN